MSAYWQELLAPYIADDFIQPNGDQNMHCPIHGDSRRSATVNFVTGEWYCNACVDGGTLEKLIDRKDDWFAPGQGHTKTAVSTTARALPDTARLDGWRSALLSNAEWMRWLKNKRGITRDTVERFGLGLSQNWLMIPILDKDGVLVNIKQYDPEATQGTKIMHWRGHGRPNRLYPFDVLLDDPTDIVLCEGELDAIIGNQYGLSAVTSTSGVKAFGKWNEAWTEWIRGRNVFICFDCDAEGRKAARALETILVSEAKTVSIVKLPYIANSKKDLTDFFLDGHTTEELFRDCVKQTRTRQNGGRKKVNNAEFDDLRRPSKIFGKHIRIPDATISGIIEGQSVVPQTLNAACEVDWDPKRCKHCPLSQLDGRKKVNIEPHEALVIDLIAGNQADKARKSAFKERLDIPHNCPQVDITVDPVGVWNGEIRNGSNLAEDSIQALMYVEGQAPRLNQLADLEGHIVITPRNSKSLFVADSVIHKKRDLESFVPDKVDIERALDFIKQLDGEPHDKADQIADLYEKHVTRIFGQRLLHIGILATYHSVCEFSIGTSPVTRGWMELLAVGDTRAGKSQTAKSINDFLHQGHMLGSENASIAGLIGGLEKSNNIGGSGFSRRLGLLPLHHKRLVILDEAQGLSPQIISQMSDVRSSGKIQVEKIQTIESPAQVRLIWLGNPREGKRFARGIDALQYQMGQPEDLSRIDLPLYIKGDVGEEFAKARIDYGEFPHDPEVLEWILLWVWSRKPEQIVWTPEAIDSVWEESAELAKDFHTNIPILQPNEAHIRLARFAVSLAGMLFSTGTGHEINVRSEHVLSAAELYRAFLSSEPLGLIDIKRDVEWREDQFRVFGGEVDELWANFTISQKHQIASQSRADRVFRSYDSMEINSGRLISLGCAEDIDGEYYFTEQFQQYARKKNEEER